MSDRYRVRIAGHVLAYGTENDRLVQFRASTPAIDRHGTIVKPDGIDTTNYDKNPVFLWAHDGYDTFAGPPSMDSVIGRVPSHEKAENYFDIVAEFAPYEVNPYGEKALRMVRAGFLNAVSIGFYPLEEGQLIVDGKNIPAYLRSELLENSLVPIPANPDALHISNALDQILGLAPPPTSGAAAGAQLREYARGIEQAERVRAFTRSLAQRTR